MLNLFQKLSKLILKLIYKLITIPILVNNHILSLIKQIMNLCSKNNKTRIKKIQYNQHRSPTNTWAYISPF